MSDPFDQVNQFIESILAGQRPNRFRADAPEDMSALRAAARLAAERDPAREGPSPEFVAKLQQQIARQSASRGAGTTSRRGFLAAALGGLAAGLGSGVGLDRLILRPSVAAPAPPSPASARLVRDNGRWFSIAKLSRLSEQATLRFTAGAVEGHLVRRGGEVMALSAICSDLPCTLVWQEKEDNFLCPCHDVLFDAQGEAKLTRRPVPPLTRLDVKVEGDDILVWSIGEDGPRQPGRPSPEEYEG